MTSTYYWRAVRRIAKRQGISLSAARKKDWQKEANAERKRRSQAHLHETVKRDKRSHKPAKPTHKPMGVGISRKRKTTRHPAKRVLHKRTRSRFTAPTPVRELTEYDEEEAEQIEEAESEFEQIWEDYWQDMYATLDDMDELDTFVEEFEYADSEQYKEPS
jgi:hypothetical protein